MANATTTRILRDGWRNAVVEVVSVLDTSNLAATDVVDPASFSPVPSTFIIDRIEHNTSGQLSVQILWDATADVVAATLNPGSETLNFKEASGLTNNAGAGKTGKIQMSTTGWASGTQTTTVTLYMRKQY